MGTMDKAPPISQELITFLDARYPDKSPNPDDTERQIWRKVGNVEVVRFLKRLFEEQNENILETKVSN